MNKLKTNSNASVVSKAKIKKVGIPQSKMKLAVDLVRGKKVDYALAILKNTRRRANSYLIDLLRSAVANALQKDSNLKPEELSISTIYANKEPVLKRLRPRAFGRGYLILKRSCQVYVELSASNAPSQTN